jgi:hypothetical protein
MLWWTERSREEAGERFRREHERWLEFVVSTGAPVPRIPVRRMDEGGFDALLARPRGREVARRWWELAFARTPDPD